MATSSEPGRTSAYSNDLRWKMVYQKEALSLTLSVIASNLCVDVSTVKRVLKVHSAEFYFHKPITVKGEGALYN